MQKPLPVKPDLKTALPNQMSVICNRFEMLPEFFPHIALLFCGSCKKTAGVCFSTDCPPLLPHHTLKLFNQFRDCFEVR